MTCTSSLRHWAAAGRVRFLHTGSHNVYHLEDIEKVVGQAPVEARPSCFMLSRGPLRVSAAIVALSTRAWGLRDLGAVVTGECTSGTCGHPSLQWKQDLHMSHKVHVG
eukprot:ANDGO_04822.mRNA.1 hypothetical protein